MNRAELIEKIRKLLNLASSDNEHEAALAATKAQELLSAYNLSMSDIPGEEASCTSAAREYARTRKRLEGWAFILATVTSEAFDCDYFHGLDQGRTAFVGVGADPAVCAWMYSYLYKTLLRLGASYLRTECRRLRSSKSKAAARESYLRGAVHTIGLRLRVQKKATPITDAALVPIKSEAIAAAMPDNLKKRPINLKHLRDVDWSNGIADGRSVSLSAPLNADQHRMLQEE